MESISEETPSGDQPLGIQGMILLLGVAAVFHLIIIYFAASHRIFFGPSGGGCLNLASLLWISIFMGVLTVGTCIGFNKGRRWGWWLGTFLYLYAAARAIGEIFISMTSDNEEILRAGQHGSGSINPMQGFLIAVNLCFFIYLLGRGAREYFDLGDLSVKRAALIQVGLALLVVVIGIMLGDLSD